MAATHTDDVTCNHSIWGALEDGLVIMIRSDLNVHIWELDSCENKNGWRMKERLNEMGLLILNCVWDGLNEVTWYTEENGFTLDYVCMDGRGMLCVSVYLI